MNTELRAVIIEDEPKGRENLKQSIATHCPDIQIVGEADTIERGMVLLTNPEIEPDVAFLDIDLPDGLVFQLLDQLQPINFEIIFVTGHNQYAITACEYSSIGYILKPMEAAKLKEAVHRIRPRSENQFDRRWKMFKDHINNPNAFSKMSIAALDGIYFVNIRDIVRFEAEDNYTHIFLQDGQRITASKTIKSYEDMLSPYNFYRVHKRHVINMNYMKMFVKGDGGYLIMDDGMKIEVSRRRRPAFMEHMKRLEGGF